MMGGSEVEAAMLSLAGNGVTFTVPDPLYPNDPFTLRFEYSSGTVAKAGEWIGLYQIGTDDDQHGGRIYRIDKKTHKKGKLRWAAKYAPWAPGQYEVCCICLVHNLLKIIFH